LKTKASNNANISLAGVISDLLRKTISLKTLIIHIWTLNIMNANKYNMIKKS